MRWCVKTNVDLSVCEMGCFRYRHEVVLYNNRILMIGGGQAVIAYSMDKVSLTEWLALWVNADIVPGSSGSLKVWYIVHSVCSVYRKITETFVAWQKS